MRSKCVTDVSRSLWASLRIGVCWTRSTSVQKETSFLQLSETCDSIGFGTGIRYYRPDDFNSLPLPAIVQFGADRPKHFFVVYRVTSAKMLTPLTERLHGAWNFGGPRLTWP